MGSYDLYSEMIYQDNMEWDFDLANINTINDILCSSVI
jgi:hypothetical protein